MSALHDDIEAILARSPTSHDTGETAEDWGIFDSDGFGPLRIDEQESLDWVSAVASGITEHGLAFAAYADVVQDEEALAGFEDDYIGEFDSVDAYAEQFVEDLGYEGILDQSLPETIRRYVHFDIEQLARDMQLGGDIHVLPAEGGRVWLFRSS